MKLDNRTVQILKNFSTINSGLLFTKGKTLTTVSPQTTVMARAQISEEIPSSFAIYELSRFLGVLSLFEAPELEITDGKMIVYSGSQKVEYVFSDPRHIVSPSEKLLNWLNTSVPEPETTFTLTSETLQKVLRAMNVLQLPHLAVTAEDGVLFLEAINPKNPTSDTYKIEVGTTDLTFKLLFKTDNIKVIPGDYEVGICLSGIAIFKGADVQYWITSDAG